MNGYTPPLCRLPVSGKDVDRISFSNRKRNFASLTIFMTVSHIGKLVSILEIRASVLELLKVSPVLA